MINIFTSCTNLSPVNGPTKVLLNTLKGLDSINYPYVINRNLSSTKRVWIQSGNQALPYIKRISAKTIIGPNTALYPSDIDCFDIRKALYLQPGPTAVDFWNTLGFNQCPLKSWAAGIDTDIFSNSSKKNKDIVLVYHKTRESKELFNIIETLVDSNTRFALIPYGSYNETDYLFYLSRSKFVIWHGCAESQGIALQEAMSCNVPILLCDVTKLDFSTHNQFVDKLSNFSATAAPYFNSNCGIRITDLSKLPQAIEQMQDTWTTFSPRDYVLNNLSLELQAKKLVKMWEYWGMTEDEGRSEILMNSKSFHISTVNKYYKKIIKRFTAK